MSPFRLDPAKYGEFRAKIQFTTAAWMPYRIWEACIATGVVSNTVYCQLAVCEKLARDLGLDLDDLIAALPRSKTSAKHLWDPDEETPRNQYGRNKYGAQGVVRYGMANTSEEVL
jgi:hypothetical protein